MPARSNITPLVSTLIADDLPWTEVEFRERAKREGLCLPPATLRLMDLPASRTETRDRIGDGVMLATWGERQERFTVEYKPVGTPKSVETAIAEARRWAEKTGLPPLVVVPYLSEDRLRTMETEGISGVDLCGNGVLLASDFYIWRTAAPNRFKSRQPIRNVYRGASSLFARSLLLKPAFGSLLSLQSFTQERLPAPLTDETASIGASRLTKGTASKVVQALVDDLIVRREGRGGVNLTDPARLLNRLRENYRRPHGRKLKGKTNLGSSVIWQRISSGTRANGSSSALRATVTGDGSAGRYGLLSGVDCLSLYVSDLDAAAQRLELRPGRVFPNIELIESADETVYFDARERPDGQWASPIQVWLELATGGPREQDAADVIYNMLLSGEAMGDGIP